MALMTKASGEGFDPVPEGVHIARCITVVDMGIQETTWNNQTKRQHKVYIAFEVPEVRVKWKKDDVEHEGAALVGQMYTNSIGDKANLGKHLTSWRGRAFSEQEKQGFDLFTILDVPCQLSVVHNQSGGNTYANIASIMGLPKGMEAPPRETELLAYTPSDPEKAGNFGKMPQWMQDKITAGKEPAGTMSTQAPQQISENPAPPGAYDDFDDDIPF